MNSPRDLRRRIKSISGTAQITKAMQMVAASKMRKAQQAAIAAGPFARLLYRIQRSATLRALDFAHPLLARARRSAGAAVILIAADKGLCGALNTNVFRLAAQFDPAVDGLHHRRPKGRAVRRAHAPAARRRVRLRGFADVRRGPGHRGLRPRSVPQGRRRPGVDRRDALRQHAHAEAGAHRISAGRRHHRAEDSRRRSRARSAADTEETLFEPSAEAVLGYLLGHYLNIYIYYVLLNAKASEQSARMVSMKNATDSAESLIDDADARIQQAAAGQHHEGAAGNRRRPGGMTRELVRRQR